MAKSRKKSPEDSSSSFFAKSLPLENETVWFILVNALDVFMTYLLLRERGFREANPVAGYFLNRWGIKGMVYFKFGLVAFVALITQVIARQNEELARKILWFGTVVVGGVVFYSLILFLQRS